MKRSRAAYQRERRKSNPSLREKERINSAKYVQTENGYFSQIAGRLNRSTLQRGGIGKVNAEQIKTLSKVCKCGNIGEEIDHIKRLKDGGLNVINNLQWICKPCHKEKTALERNGITTETPKYQETQFSLFQ